MIGNSVGNVIHSQDKEELIGGGFLQIRVNVECTKPLCRGRQVLLEEGREAPPFNHGKKTLVSVKGYEVEEEEGSQSAPSSVEGQATSPPQIIIIGGVISITQELRIEHSIMDNLGITELFLPHEVLLIQSIPLSQRPIEEKLVWSHSSSNVYTVKYGYKILSQEVVVSDYRAQGVDKDVWKVVWGLKVQNKIRNFIWRAIRNSIPVKTNLVKRKALVDDSCDHCHHDPEDVLHALWQCPLLDPVWSSNPSWDFRASSQFSSFMELVQYLIKESLNIGLFAQISWTIWFRRNQLRTSTKPFHVEQVVPDALAALSAFIRAIPPKLPDNEIRPPHHIKWKPPNPNCLKMLHLFFQSGSPGIRESLLAQPLED
nr:hypothetical protein CFP56_12599 [Quercus suber]